MAKHELNFLELVQGFRRGELLTEGDAKPIELTARFRWRASGGGAQLGFVWHRVEYQRRAHFTEIATKAAEETGLPVFAGRFAN